MPDSHPQAMPKKICCRNWVHLFDYIENTPNLQGGFSGRAAVDKVLEGLVDNPEYPIEHPDNPDKAYPVTEAHLRGGSYWHSHAFSLKLFENAARLIGGYRPLFHAGITAGYRMFESAQPEHFRLLRLLSPKTTLRLMGFINRKFNKAEDPKGIEWRKDSTKPTTGTGLGLGIVRRLVRLYGGSIDVESNGGHGTKFTAAIGT